MPRKATRKSKASVDARPRAVRHSAREKDQAGSPPSASNPGFERTPRGDASALAAAARYIRGDEGANRRDAGDAQQFHAEQERIQEWVRSQGCLIGEADFEALGVISNSTSEHEVRGRPADDRVVKKTWPGFYGQVPVWKNGRLERAPALPSQYLERQLLQNAIFNSEILLEGVLVSNKPSMIIGESSGQPAFVILQPFIKALQPGTPGPSEPEIAAFLAAHDFEPVTGSYFGWQRVSDGVVLLDARRDNFILVRRGRDPD